MTPREPETARTSPECMPATARGPAATRKGRATVIILDRDGSLRHYEPGHARLDAEGAQVTLNEPEAQPGLLDRLIHFAFDVLGVNSLEIRVNERPER